MNAVKKYSCAYKGLCYVVLFLVAFFSFTSCGNSYRKQVRVSEIEGRFVSVVASNGTTFAVHEDGTIWWWGRNVGRDFGWNHGNDRDESGIEFIGARRMDLPDVVMVSSSGIGNRSGARGHAMAVNSQGELWGWGYNLHGQIGDGTSSFRATPQKIMHDVTFVHTTATGTFAITKDHKLWTWGWMHPNLGDLDTIFWHPVVLIEDITVVASSPWATLAVDSGGTLWGSGLGSMLGIGIVHQNNLPTSEVPIATEFVEIMTDVVDVAVGGFSALAVTSSGELWMWGYPYRGRDAIGFPEEINNPYPVLLMQDVAYVASGHLISAAISSDGGLYVWGHHPSTEESGESDITPHPIRIMDGVASVGISASLVISHTHIVAIAHDGSIWAWGANLFGQIGDGTPFNADIWEPALVHSPRYR